MFVVLQTSKSVHVTWKFIYLTPHVTPALISVFLRIAQCYILWRVKTVLPYLFRLVTSVENGAGKCSAVERVGRALDGGYDVCMSPPFRPQPGNCLVYSFGLVCVTFNRNVPPLFSNVNILTLHRCVSLSWHLFLFHYFITKFLQLQFL